MQRKLILILFLLFLSLSVIGNDRFIKVINNNNSYLLEIEDSLLGRDILFGSRIVDLSSPSAKVYAAGQIRTPPTLIRFVRNGNLLLIQEIVDFTNISKEDPIYGAAQRNMRMGSVQIFDIKSRKETSSVIDVTKYFSEEVAIAWPLPENVKKGKLEPRLSRIESVKEYSDHLNVRTHYEYTGGKEPFTITVQYFMLLLSKEPAKLRVTDDRVGYQSISITNLSSGQVIEKSKYISRWRLEVKPEDISRYKQGELVEPVKPIIVYVEPYFPKPWIKYIKSGIEDWQVAFEAIGFKNAIIAKEFPSNPDFDSEDISVNVVRYIPVQEANAAGQIWIDPRSGEIIQGDVLWWNDVIDLIKMWRFTQTAVVDTAARSLKYSDEMIGESVRYAIAHEIGHMLGLQHNMRSSFSYPVDSLRSPTFTQKFGTTASIMDYARNNHVAQEGDIQRGVKMVPPHIGPFDILSIEYGYKPIFEAKSPEDEKPVLDSIFRSKGDNPMFKFASFITSPISPDPSAQSESLGDDVIKSAGLGMINNRKIVENLVEWTLNAGGNSNDISKRYEALVKQYYKYITSTLSYIGGIYEFQTSSFGAEEKFFPVKKNKQKEALYFAVEALKKAPGLLDRKEITQIIGSQSDMILKRQTEAVSQLLSNLLIPRISRSDFLEGTKYSLSEYFQDLDILLLTEYSQSSPYDQSVRISYIQLLTKLSQMPDVKDNIPSTNELMVSQAAFNQLSNTRKWLIKRAGTKGAEAQHYKYLLQIIEKQKQ